MITKKAFLSFVLGISSIPVNAFPIKYLPFSALNISISYQIPTFFSAQYFHFLSNTYLFQRSIFPFPIKYLPFSALNISISYQIPTFFSAQYFHFLGNFWRPPCDCHMQTIITADFGVCPASPLLIGIQQGFSSLGDDKVNWGTDLGGEDEVAIMNVVEIKKKANLHVD